MKARTDKQYRETLMLVLNEIKNLNLLSNKLLLLAHTSTDQAHLNFTPVRIDDVLWKARNEILTRNKEYSIDIYFGDNMDDDIKMSVLGNELLLKTAINNLMENACKYSNNHRAEIKLDASESKLIIQFIDQGIGIPEQDLTMIFQPFFRSKNVFNISGHGIGLSLVDKIIAQHHGQIEVTSKPEKGSTFTIILSIHP
jgi:signal transduction histidine kinase